MSAGYLSHTGEHPSGRKASIYTHPNGYCTWHLIDTTGAVILTGTAINADVAKREVKKNTFNVNDALRPDMAPFMALNYRWTWKEVQT